MVVDFGGSGRGSKDVGFIVLSTRTDLRESENMIFSFALKLAV